MMNKAEETEEMRQARHDLQLLSASDPAAGANMMKYVAAYSIMLTGRRGRDRRQGEPQLGAGFVLTHGDQNLCAAAARRSGTDYIYIAFDVDDAAGPPLAAGVFRKQDDNMFVYGDCRLWSPANDGRALLVPMGIGPEVGHFAFRPGRTLKLVDAPVPGDLQAGLRRASARMQRLLSSDALRDVHREGYMHCIHNVGQDIYAETSRLAA
ncbi:hypothetical protein ASG29_06615 [Sphingomonas sp. Leaf412]|uniref:hypothetical protein n=1 Tax=Sphingomonas sp. Leaf412 TaxID=1736370 RepID=UPI0006F713A2|nr:hypothetical protein [Sphingomonas sp. Leaf412]KQT33679.1 hypothetical protein ASG29_06615 [Sphingomonas sp. Leaf412]